MKTTLVTTITVLLFFTLAAQLFLSEQFVSMTWDEPQHIAAGYSKLITGDFRMNTEHPPLMHFLEGLPLLFLNPKLKLDENWNNKNMIEFTRQFFFVANKNPKELLFYGRILIILLTLLLGIVVFLWTEEMFGINAAIIALTLYSFEPNILAHGILATTDMGFAFFGTLALYTYWRFFQKSTTTRLILASITMGLAQLSKYTALFLWPAYLLIIFTAAKKNKWLFHLKAFCGIAVISLFLINTAYLFQGTFVPLKQSMLQDSALDKRLTNVFSNGVNFLTETIPSPLPYYYIKGLGFVTYEGGKENPNIVLGKEYPKGTWWYYVLAFFVKTTIPFIILTIISLLLLKNTNKKWQFTLLPAATIFLVLSFMTKQAGIRYVLVIFPLLCIFIAGQLSAKQIVRRKLFAHCVVAILSLHALSSAAQFPNYLSYYNEFAGAENGWKYFVDSNTDWGQDFDKLRKYVACEPDTKIKYFGTPDLAFYGLDTKKAKEHCEKGMLAISATYTADKSFRWLKNFKPTDRIGNSILLYNVTNCNVHNG